VAVRMGYNGTLSVLLFVSTSVFQYFRAPEHSARERRPLVARTEVMDMRQSSTA